MRKAITLLTALVLGLLAFSAVLIPLANADWAMFHADPSHSGAGTGTSVLNPKELWSYTTGGEVLSSPAVVNGVVYVGSFDHDVYALNATNGAQLWNYTTEGWICVVSCCCRRRSLHWLTMTITFML